MKQPPAPVPEDEPITADTPMHVWVDRQLALALRNQGMILNGFVERGGCVIRYRLIVTDVDLATATYPNPETRH